ncbi:MAG TPA: hydroxymethylbilane synthase [bacterium]|jgi:hydroxymethylbilane synthase
MRAGFVVGTRGSALALAQTESVLSILRAARPAVAFNVITVRTTADRLPDRALARLPGIGFFVKELEQALLAESIDVAVHSMKDLPTEHAPGLTIAAVTAREDPRDVLVARDGLTLATLPAGSRIGTSSPRRAGFLLAARPDVQVVLVRGNVETRIRKVEVKELDAVCLAAAGLLRLGQGSRITDWLSVHAMLPAPGQGALGVQVRAADADAAAVVAAADDLPTRAAVTAERAMLNRLEGGCRLPAGALARVGENRGAEDRMDALAAVVSPDGRHIMRSQRSGFVRDANAIGIALADDLLAQGAGRLAVEQVRSE